MNPNPRRHLTDQALDDLAFGEKYGVFSNPEGRALKRCLRLDVCDPTIAGLIHSRVSGLRRQEAFGELVPFRSPPDRSGDLKVEDLRGRELSFPSSILPKNVLQCSAPGGGKTVGCAHFSLEIASPSVFQWHLENYKEHQRHLRPLFLKRGLDLVVLRPERWRFNPLQAGPCDPQSYLSLITDILNRELDLPERGRTIVAQVGYDLYREFRNLEGCTDRWPTLHHLYERIRAMRGYNTSARDAVLDRLASVLPGLGPAYYRGWHPTELAGRSIVLEMGRASPRARNLFMSVHLFTVLHHAYARGLVNRKLNLVIFVDDGQRIATERGQSGEMPTLAEYLTVNREGGICVWLNLQSMDGVPPLLRSTFGTKIMGVLNSHADYQILGPDMLMDPRQIAWAALNLEPRTFIIQMADGNYRQPFPFRVPITNIPSVVDDGEADESLRALEDIPTERATEFDHWEPHHVVEVSGPAPAPEESRSAPLLTETEQRFLKAVIDDPGKPSSLYARLARIGGKQAVAIRERLVKAGFLREHELATGQRGRQAIILEPLEPAFRALANRGGAR
jgi:hypothetical protein